MSEVISADIGGTLAKIAIFTDGPLPAFDNEAHQIFDRICITSNKY